MNEMTTSHGLPPHGVKRAAARVHHIAAARDSKQVWNDLSDAAQQYFCTAVWHILRDLGPDQDVIVTMPLIWYSPSWGILFAERDGWMKGSRDVVSLRHGDVIELPDDVYLMAPVQPCRLASNRSAA